MSQHDALVAQRQAKFDALVALGVDPWPHAFAPTHSIHALVQEHGARSADALEAAAIRVRVAGRMLGLRSFGRASFAVLSDGRSRVQVYVREDSLPARDFQVFRLLDLGDLIGVEGRLFRTRTGEFSVWASALVFLAKCFLPLPEKWHGLQDVETRYRQRYLDLIVNPDSRRVFETRSRIVAAIRAFYAARDFLEVETPMMQPIAGGALARPFVTHHNALDMPLYLRIAPELYLKRLVVGGMERVFEINRNFRNEGLSTQHNPEFTMLESYQAYADYTEVMAMVEALVEHVALAAAGTVHIRFGGRDISLAPPFARVRLRDEAARAAAERLGTPVAVEDLRPAPAASPPTSSRPCARIASCSRPSCTTIRRRSRPCRSSGATIRTRWSGSSSTSAASRWPTASASSTTRPSSAAASRSSSGGGRRARPRRTRWTRTTSAPFNTACRRRAASASASTASRCSSPIRPRSATSFSSR
jgi:lysyl-tRNA synthetase class 2